GGRAGGRRAHAAAGVKEERAGKHEPELQRARGGRARAAAEAAAARAAAPAATPAQAAPRPASPPSRPLGVDSRTRGPRRRDRKNKKKAVDEKLVQESVRKTLASLDAGGARRRHRRREDENGEIATEEAKVIRAAEFITVAELANLMEVRPQEVIAVCMRLGLMATINKRLDKDAMQAVADEFGFQVEFLSEYGEAETEA